MQTGYSDNASDWAVNYVVVTWLNSQLVCYAVVTSQVGIRYQLWNPQHVTEVQWRVTTVTYLECPLNTTVETFVVGGHDLVFERIAQSTQVAFFPQPVSSYYVSTDDYFRT